MRELHPVAGITSREITGRTLLFVCMCWGWNSRCRLHLGNRSTTEVYPHTSWPVLKILLYGPGWFGTLEFNRSSRLSLQGGGTLQAKATGATHQFSSSGQSTFLTLVQEVMRTEGSPRPRSRRSPPRRALHISKNTGRWLRR